MFAVFCTRLRAPSPKVHSLPFPPCSSRFWLMMWCLWAEGRAGEPQCGNLRQGQSTRRAELDQTQETETVSLSGQINHSVRIDLRSEPQATSLEINELETTVIKMDSADV